MDAVKFLKEKNHMCNTYKNCFECPVGTKNGGCQIGIVRDQEMTEEELVSIVENWASNHPVKTRQSEFMKLFPNVILNECESIAICPRIVDANFGECEGAGCLKCEKEYWLAEVK